MRGKVHIVIHTIAIIRITPAYAGKSIKTAGRDRYTRDHPRLCGEKFLIARNRPHQSGSPPPMRGKEELFYKNLLTKGITPAYAGKSGNFHGC